MVRREQRRAAIALRLRNLRIDEQRNPRGLRRRTSGVDDRPADDALAVVGQDERLARSRGSLTCAMSAVERGAGRVGVLFVVDARHLLVARRHDAHLAGRRPRRIADEAGGVDPAPRPARARSSPRRVVGADERPRASTRPPSDATLCATLAAPPSRYSSRVESHDRHGRFRRDAIDACRSGSDRASRRR